MLWQFNTRVKQKFFSNGLFRFAMACFYLQWFVGMHRERHTLDLLTCVKCQSHGGFNTRLGPLEWSHLATPWVGMGENCNARSFHFKIYHSFGPGPTCPHMHTHNAQLTDTVVRRHNIDVLYPMIDDLSNCG